MPFSPTPRVATAFDPPPPSVFVPSEPVVPSSPGDVYEDDSGRLRYRSGVVVGGRSVGGQFVPPPDAPPSGFWESPGQLRSWVQDYAPGLNPYLVSERQVLDEDALRPWMHRPRVHGITPYIPRLPGERATLFGSELPPVVETTWHGRIRSGIRSRLPSALSPDVPLGERMWQSTLSNLIPNESWEEPGVANWLRRGGHNVRQDALNIGTRLWPFFPDRELASERLSDLSGWRRSPAPLFKFLTQYPSWAWKIPENVVRRAIGKPTIPLFFEPHNVWGKVFSSQVQWPPASDYMLGTVSQPGFTARDAMRMDHLDRLERHYIRAGTPLDPQHERFRGSQQLFSQSGNNVRWIDAWYQAQESRLQRIKGVTWDENQWRLLDWTSGRYGQAASNLRRSPLTTGSERLVRDPLAVASDAWWSFYDDIHVPRVETRSAPVAWDAAGRLRYQSGAELGGRSVGGRYAPLSDLTVRQEFSPSAFLRTSGRGAWAAGRRALGPAAFAFDVYEGYEGYLSWLSLARAWP